MRQGRVQAGEHELRLPADRVADRGRGALVRRAEHHDSGVELEQLGRVVRGGAVAGRGIGVLVGLGLELRHQVPDILHRYVGRRDHQRRRVADQADRREVGDRVVAQLLQRGIHRVRGDVAEHQGMAVGRGTADELARDRTVGACPVVDDHRLAEQRPELLGDGARHRVVAATGRGRHDDRDGLVGVGHGGRSCGSQRRGEGGCDQTFHGLVSFVGIREHVGRDVKLALQDLSGGADERCALDAGVGADDPRPPPRRRCVLGDAAPR